MAKYLGQTGLIYLWGKIKAYVSNYVSISNGTITIGSNSITPVTDVSGKQDTIDSSHKLSADLISDGTTNKAYTATEKTKLSGVESGAEVNQNAFSTIKIGSTNVAADAKTDVLELVAGDNVTITPDATNDKITISAANSEYTAASETPLMDGTASVGTSSKYAREDHVHPSDTAKQDKIDSSHKLSADLISDGTTNKAYTATEQSKLANISAGAEVNQNAFNTIKVSPASGDSTSIVADSKTDTLELKAGSNVTLTPDATNDKITIASADTKNTAGADDTSSKIFLVGVTSQTSSDGTARTYSQDTAYVGTDGCLYSGGAKVVTDISGKVNTSAVGAANGVCPLDSNAKIDSSYLPSYVDDVVECYIKTGETALGSTFLATGSATGTAITPETGKIYVILNSSTDYPTNTQFRWGGTSYVKLNDGGISEMTTSEMDTATSNWA